MDFLINDVKFQLNFCVNPTMIHWSVLLACHSLWKILPLNKLSPCNLLK